MAGDALAKEHKRNGEGKMARKKYGVIKLSAAAGSLDHSKCSKSQLEVLKRHPVVYIYYGKKAFYVGQTKQFLVRHGQHLREKGTDYRKLDKILILYGQYVDGNSQTDLERLLITYLTADNNARPAKERKRCLNRTPGNWTPKYLTKEQVRAEVLAPFWRNELMPEALAHEDHLEKLRQSILFKYSPFADLSSEQVRLIEEIKKGGKNYLIEGLAGTGKTVVLTNLVAGLCETESEKQPKIGVVVRKNWKDTAKKIFRAYGLGKNVCVNSAAGMIHTAEHYDIILVDEAHRLRWNYSKQHPSTRKLFDKNDPQKNELFLLGEMTDRLVLFYDGLQRIRPSDIPRADFSQYIKRHHFHKRALWKQFRIQLHDTGASYTSDDYVSGICTFLQLEKKPYDRRVFQNQASDAYFGVVNSISELFAYVDEQRQYHPTAQCRVVAGYARFWGSQYSPQKKKHTDFDWVEDEQNRWRWNNSQERWLFRPDTEDEIGSIHAVQGNDLDYVGVIIARDIGIVDGKVVAVKENYYDNLGTPIKKGDYEKELTQYVKQVYYVLLTRGISGIRVYFEDDALKRYFMKEVGLQ